jgi:hypothetical protein
MIQTPNNPAPEPDTESASSQPVTRDSLYTQALSQRHKPTAPRQHHLTGIFHFSFERTIGDSSTSPLAGPGLSQSGSSGWRLFACRLSVSLKCRCSLLAGVGGCSRGPAVAARGVRWTGRVVHIPRRGLLRPSAGQDAHGDSSGRRLQNFAMHVVVSRGHLMREATSRIAQIAQCKPCRQQRFDALHQLAFPRTHERRSVR